MHKRLYRFVRPLLGLVGLSLLVGTVQADAALTADLLRTFAQCDARFFAQLAKTPNLVQLGQLETAPGFANFKVPERHSDDKNQMAFSQPVQIGGLTLTGYEDSYSNLGADGRYWYWGFHIKGTPSEVLRALPAEIRTALRQDKAGEWARAERMVLSASTRRWLPIEGDGSGNVPAEGTVERALLLAPAVHSPDTALLCSIQGAPDDAILKEIRPDDWKKMTDPAYLKAKQQVISSILATYTPFSMPGGEKSEDTVHQEIHQATLQLKARYEEVQDVRPAEFWQAYEQALFKLRWEGLHPSIATSKMKDTLQDVMWKFADLDELQEIAKEDDPRWPSLIMRGIMKDKWYFAAKDEAYLIAFVQQERALFRPVEARFGKLHKFPLSK
ncbi:hypothetical protein [Paludibacterium purpuratum]|uniref:Uncharacterized protein n=1 Tax=Paludibacterium purpuratum TaxID=1144873 RepID=A0A4R7ATY0_9NEIS|nr:hypothetical protein [Paludibacterium purpuratum]TDR70234.1 hypothetical protein DFP86_1263 [Paludibacterium purpuratum]